MRRNPYVLIGGCPRSGTTLVQRMLDAHPRLAVAFEMDLGLDVGPDGAYSGTAWLESWYRDLVGLTPDGFATTAFVERLLASPQFMQVGFDPERVRTIVKGGEAVSHADFVTKIFDLYGEMSGKELVGDKSPKYVRGIPALHALWPEARLVHIVRDGRDAYLSQRNWRKIGPATVPQWNAGRGPLMRVVGHGPDDLHGAFPFGDYRMSRFPGWEQDPVVTHALWWKWTVLLGRQHGAALGPRVYHEVRYEDLVTDPVRISQALCSFLNLPFATEVVRFADGKTKNNSRLTTKQRWLPPTPGLRNWRAEMPPGEMERFEIVAGDLLEELGYDRVVSQAPFESTRAAAGIAEMFVEGLLAKGADVPPGLWNG